MSGNKVSQASQASKASQSSQVTIIEISTIARIFINRVNVIVRDIFAQEDNPINIDFVNKIFNTFDYSFINEPVKRSSKSKSDEPEIVKKPKSKKPKPRFFNITSDCKQAMLWIMNDIVEFCNKDDNESHKNLIANIQADINEFLTFEDCYLAPMNSFAVGLSYWVVSNEIVNVDKKDKDGDDGDDDDNSNNGDDSDDGDDEDSRIKKLYTKEKTSDMLYNAFYSGYSKLGISNVRTINKFASDTVKLFEYFINLVARQTAQNNLRNRRFVLSEQIFENLLTIVFDSSMLTLKLSNYMNNKPKKVVQPRKKKQSELEQAVSLLEKTVFENREEGQDDSASPVIEDDEADESREEDEDHEDTINNQVNPVNENDEGDEFNEVNEVNENGEVDEVNESDFGADDDY